MSQLNVERIIGLLATDEALRHEFTTDPSRALQKLIEGGMDLNPCELRSLARLSPTELARFAEIIDSRLQKTDLKRGAP